MLVNGGASRDRTDDLLRARQALSQLSYDPKLNWWVWADLNRRPHPYQGCALTKTELQTQKNNIMQTICKSTFNHESTDTFPFPFPKRFCKQKSLELGKFYKEVIQPQVPLRLPCYDFAPVINHTVVIDPLSVSLTTSGATYSHGVTGGVYKARERIHRSVLIYDY